MDISLPLQSKIFKGRPLTARHAAWYTPLGMSSRSLFLALIALAVAFEVVADVLFKKWAMENRGVLLAIGLALYFIGTVFWAISLRTTGLSRAVTVFTVVNLLAVVIAGVLIFGEQLTTMQKVGVGLGVLSVLLLEL